jgi:PAS domain S-box-containing protein
MAKKKPILKNAGSGPDQSGVPNGNRHPTQNPPVSKIENDKTAHVLRDADVPDPFYSIFLRAQLYAEQYFGNRKEIPRKGMIEISGERYILVRAAAMSKEFFDLVTSLYHDRGEKAARNVTFSLLYDFAHAIGKSDARSFFAKMSVKDPIEKLSAGPIHFAHTGWAYVKILPQSNPKPDETYYLIYDHPFSFEAHNWLAAETITNFPVCTMNAGYSSGWCEESFGIPLVAAEVECRAKGDAQCRFIMAPPDKIKDHIERYSRRSGNRPVDFGSIDIPEFFQRKRLEDRLMNSEETVRTLLNAPNDQSLLIDTQGKLLALNRKAAAAFGKSQDELVGQNLFHLLPPSLAHKRRLLHHQVIETGESYRFEDQHGGRWLDTTIDPVTNAKGKVVRLAVVSRDITGYRRMAEALRKEKEFNATLIETSPAWFVAIAAKGKTLFMNAAMLNALGYTRDEVVGRNYLKTFIPRLERIRLVKLLGQSQPGGIIQIKYGQITTKDGRTRYVEWHGRQIFKPNGKLDFFFALGIDITERKKIEDELQRHQDHLEELVKERTAELTSINEKLENEVQMRRRVKQALEKSETMLEAIFDQTFQFVSVLSMDGTLIKVNKTAIDFIQTTEAEVIGRPFWETPWWSGSKIAQEHLRSAINLAVLGQLVRFETTHTSPEGRSMRIDFSLKPVTDDKGHIVLLIAEGRDITELKSAIGDLSRRESELKRQSRNLEEANIALKVILKQQEDKRVEDQETILANIKQSVLPYVNRLKKRGPHQGQKILVEALENNLNKITSPMITKLTSTFLNLTPMEIRIAQLVKEGLANKEIAELLGTSLNTIASHRYQIRSKLGLKNKGANLRSYLLSLE